MFKEFKTLIENQTGRHIRILRSDNKSEYESIEDSGDVIFHEEVVFCQTQELSKEDEIPPLKFPI